MVARGGAPDRGGAADAGACTPTEEGAIGPAVRLKLALCALLVVAGAAGLIWCAGVLATHPGALDARAPLLQVYVCLFVGMLALGVWLGSTVLRRRRQREQGHPSGGEDARRD